MSIVLIGNNAPPVADIGLTDVLDGARKRREEDAFATPRGFVGQLVDLGFDVLGGLFGGHDRCLPSC